MYSRQQSVSSAGSDDDKRVLAGIAMCQLGSNFAVAALALQQDQPGLLLARQQNRGTRRFAKRRRTLAAFTAIMGRISGGGGGGSGAGGGGPFFKVQYRRLAEEPSPVKRPRSAKPEPKKPLDGPASYCCCRCGHTQKLKVSRPPG